MTATSIFSVRKNVARCDCGFGIWQIAQLAISCSFVEGGPTSATFMNLNPCDSPMCLVIMHAEGGRSSQTEGKRFGDKSVLGVNKYCLAIMKILNYFLHRS